MAPTWLSLPLSDVAENYSGEILDNMQDYGIIATDGYNLSWCLMARARLEREGFLTDDVKRADAEVIRAAADTGYRWPVSSKDGPEWLFHLNEIGKGKLPLEQIPEHVRDLARDLYYAKAAGAA